MGVVTRFVFDPVHLDSLLGSTRLHVRTRSFATAHAACVLFTDAFVFAVMARLGHLARAIVTLGIFVVIACFFVCATRESSGGGTRGGTRGCGLSYWGGGAGSGGGTRGCLTIIFNWLALARSALAAEFFFEIFTRLAEFHPLIAALSVAFVVCTYFRVRGAFAPSTVATVILLEHSACVVLLIGPVITSMPLARFLTAT